MFLVDSHCHLHMLDLTADGGDLTKLVKRATENGVGHILNVCVSLEEFPLVLSIAKSFPYVSASLGIHPNETAKKVDVDYLVKLGGDSKVVAIGETGLDYFRSEEGANWQQERFRTHIQAAKTLKKPLIVHTRAAKKDTITLLREEGANEVGGVMHCFTEDWPMAKEALDMNFFVSFSGIVTFKNATAIQEVAKRIPLDRMLIETDSPYLAPNPYRGKQNEPSYVLHTADYLANLHAINLEKFAEQTTQNFFELFKGAVKTHV